MRSSLIGSPISELNGKLAMPKNKHTQWRLNSSCYSNTLVCIRQLSMGLTWNDLAWIPNLCVWSKSKQKVKTNTCRLRKIINENFIKSSRCSGGSLPKKTVRYHATHIQKYLHVAGYKLNMNVHNYKHPKCGRLQFWTSSICHTHINDDMFVSNQLSYFSPTPSMRIMTTKC